jgi:hypothetical protein
MSIYGTGNYAQTYTAERYEDERRQRQELAELFQTLTGQQNLIRIKLEIWCRNGPSQQLRKDINEAAEAYGVAFDKIMNSSPPRLTGPSR